MSSRSPNSGFFTRMQEDGLGLCMLIDLETRGMDFHWTTANDKVTYTLSSVPTVYEPFPGQTLDGLRQTSDLSISATDFVIANTGDLFPELLDKKDLDFATVKIGRVFVETPDLGRMEIYEGRLAEYAYDRNAISGQARNRWNSANIRWPYYNYQDKCVWRFGSTGCGFDTSSITLSFTVADIVVGSTTQIAIRFVNSTISNSYANGRFDFGRITVTDGPNSGHIRTIRSHSADLFFLSHDLPVNSFATFGFDVFPGCRKRKTEDCTSLYNNAENFVGFPWIPIQEDGF